MKITALTTLLAFGFVTGAFAADAPPAEVVYIDHAKVAEAFVKGGALQVNSSYKVQAGRRIEPGNVEIHEHDTDIFYITEGSATFVTGGVATNTKTVSPGEIRGEKITGGVTHKLTKGDIITVPAGTPHWFTAVNGPFLYLVVKVTK